MQANFYKEKIEELCDLFPISSPPFPSNNPHDLLINYVDSEEEMHDYARSLLGLTWTEIDCKFWYDCGDYLFFATPKGFSYFLPSLIKCRYEWFLDHEITVGTAIDFVFYCIVGNFDNDAEFEYALTQDDKGYLLNRIYEVFLSYNIDQILAVKQWITQEEASDMRLSKGAFNATTYRRIYYLLNNVLKVR